MKKLTCALSATALLFSSLAAYADTVDTYEFHTVTSFQNTYVGGAFPLATLTMTVLLVGSSTPTTITLPTGGVTCAQYYEWMMREPGKYTMSLTVKTTQITDLSGNVTTRREGTACSFTPNP